MSLLEDRRHSLIAQATLADLFTPSPRRTPTPLARGESSSTRTVSALTALTPLSASHAPSAFIDLDTSNAPDVSGLQPAHYGVPASAGQKTRTGDKKDVLSLDQIKAAARGRLREIHCPWRDEVKNGTKFCDAVLASYNLFRKHVKRHCQKIHEARVSRAELNEDVSPLQCGWPGCDWETDETVTKLELHVQKDHLREVQDTFCPFKDCFGPNLTVGEYRSQDHYKPLGHPHPWSTRSLRPSPVNLAQNHISPPTPPPLPETATIDPYLAHAQPYREKANPPTNVPGRRRGLSTFRSTPPPALRDLLESIVPSSFYREDYFTPMNNDAPVGYFHSYSFFRHPFTHTPEGTLYPDDNTYYVLRGRRKISAETLRKSMRGKEDENGVDEGVSPLTDLRPIGTCPDSTASMVPVARPERGYDMVIPFRAPLCALNHSNQQGKKRLLDGDQDSLKSGTTDSAATQTQHIGSTSKAQKRFAHAQVIQASKRYAQRTSKKSSGFDHWVERVKFEKRGHDLGECAFEF